MKRKPETAAADNRNRPYRVRRGRATCGGRQPGCRLLGEDSPDALKARECYAERFIGCWSSLRSLRLW